MSVLRRCPRQRAQSTVASVMHHRGSPASTGQVWRNMPRTSGQTLRHPADGASRALQNQNSVCTVTTHIFAHEARRATLQMRVALRLTFPLTRQRRSPPAADPRDHMPYRRASEPTG